mmetsp:Transcript_26877/g.41200  ORF Transcript_26877/g.41200 Transcript_26877/m.41200 type:complete len:177 (+) Transcript_26877:88-618(+)
MSYGPNLSNADLEFRSSTISTVPLSIACAGQGRSNQHNVSIVVVVDQLLPNIFTISLTHWERDPIHQTHNHWMDQEGTLYKITDNNITTHPAIQIGRQVSTHTLEALVTTERIPINSIPVACISNQNNYTCQRDNRLTNQHPTNPTHTPTENIHTPTTTIHLMTQNLPPNQGRQSL